MATTRDPFESYLLKAENLFQAGDIVQAGQIWQAILKKSPNHSDARAGLYKVKIYFDARATQDGLIPPTEASANPLPDPPPVVAPAVSRTDDIERLLRDGCTLFDMGQSQDALKKWEQILELEPGHPLAIEYIKDAKKDLGLDTALDAPAPPPESLQESEPAPAPALPQRDLSERIHQLLRDGTQLYDMGMAEEACLKWEQILALYPDHKDAQTYLAMALRERSATPAPPPPSAPPTPALRPAEDPEVRLRKAESLLHQGRLDESAFLFQEILNVAPQNFRARQGLRQANGLMEARQHTHAAPAPDMYPPTPPIPWAEALVAQLDEIPAEIPPASDSGTEGIQPPATLTTPPPPARKGLEIPKLLHQLQDEIPTWLKTPAAIGVLVGGILLLNLAFLWFRSHRKDVLLANAVVDFRTSAQGPITRNLDLTDLTENPATVRKEAESLVESQPLFAYYRGQELIRLNPLDGPAAKLMGRAGQIMAQAPTTGKGSLKDVEKLLATGDLDGARKMLLNLLQATPDDPGLKARAARVSLSLTEIYALKERWGDAEDQLKEGQMMFPGDKSWAARLQLLNRIKSLPAEERKAWISLLG